MTVLVIAVIVVVGLVVQHATRSPAKGTASQVASSQASAACQTWRGYQNSDSLVLANRAAADADAAARGDARYMQLATDMHTVIGESSIDQINDDFAADKAVKTDCATIGITDIP